MGRYIAVALIENKDGESILRELIPELETVLKENARPRHSGSTTGQSAAESKMASVDNRLPL